MPIIANLVDKKSSSGLSLTSWICNAVGLTAAIIYPYKKRFPLSTYLDAGVLLAQVLFILTLTAIYEGKVWQWVYGLVVYGTISSALLSTRFPERYLTGIQVIAAVCCCYALVPQIIMNAQVHTVTFSPVTAAIGAIGNAVRLFNAYQLTRDPLVMTGSGIATVANIIIMLQWYYYTYM